MIIKKLFSNESEYLDFVWKFVRPSINEVWREEDKPLLEPFFKASNSSPFIKPIEFSEEVKKSCDHYKKCYEEYAKELFEIKDSVRLFNRDELFSFFFLMSEDSYELEHYEKLSRDILKIDPEYEMAFPMVFVGAIESGFDRCGNSKIAFSEFVSYTEFEV